MKRYLSIFFIIGSVVFGLGSMGLFSAFLLLGSLELFDLQFDLGALISFDLVLCLAFFLQHSLMVRQRFRSQFSKQFHELYGRAMYSMVSGVVLLMVILLWQKSEVLLFRAQRPFSFFFHLGFIASCFGFMWSGLAFDTI